MIFIINMSNPATARRGVTRAVRLQPVRVPRACVCWEGLKITNLKSPCIRF